MPTVAFQRQDIFLVTMWTHSEVMHKQRYSHGDKVSEAREAFGTGRVGKVLDGSLNKFSRKQGLAYVCTGEPNDESAWDIGFSIMN